jgi:hypothetical protein
MPSVVDICNLALSHLGDRATLSSIDPPEGSSQADHCAQFWPIARDEALASADWRFASHVEAVTQLDDSIQNNPSWLYAYALPTDFLVAREMVYAEGTLFVLDPREPNFEGGTIDSGQNVLFTNLEDLSLRYTRKVVDPSKYSPKFVTAVSYLLASYLAGPVVKGRTAVQMATAMRAAWDRLAGAASVTDANQANARSYYSPGGVRARGSTAGTQTVEHGQYRHELPYWAQS